jgi:hypothetical protein
MLSSAEIAQLFAAQNMMFAGQNQFAQNIGVPPPMFSPGGLNAAGFRGGPVSASYGPGNSFAGSGMSAIGAIPAITGAGIGIAGMFGRLGGAAPFVDPFAAFGAARAAGFGVMGGLGAAALPVGAGMLASQAVSSFVHGGQQQAGINTALGGFGFFNPNNRTGAGFSRQDAGAVQQSIRQLADIPEMMTSVQELTSLIPKLRQIGVMQGVNNVAEFNRRFKEAVGTIRDTARILGTTMEEATNFFTQSRGSGFLGRTDMLRNALNVQYTSAVTGMSVGQVSQLQAAGADMSTQAGGRRRMGALAATNVAQMIGRGQEIGAVSQGLVEDITGQTGSDAVQSAAIRMTGLAMKMARSTSAGRVMMAGMTKFDDEGNVVGLDPEMVARFNRGEISLSDLKSRASGMTQKQKADFESRQASLSTSFAGNINMAKFLDGVVGDRYGSGGPRKLLQDYGASESEADLMMSMKDMLPDNQQSSFNQFRGREMSISDRTDPAKVAARVKAKLRSATTGRLEALGATVHQAMGRAVDDFIDDLVGRSAITLSDQGAEAFRRAIISGNTKDLQTIFQALNSAPAVTPGVMNRLGAMVGNSNDFASLQSNGLTTGRGATNQLAVAQSLIAGRATGDATYSRLASGLNRGVGLDLDRTTMGRVSAFVGSMRSGTANFRDMDDAKKLETLTSGIFNEITVGFRASGASGDAISKLEAGIRSGDVDMMRSALENDTNGRVSADQVLQTMNLSESARQRNSSRLIQAVMSSARAGYGLAGVVSAAQGKNQGLSNQIDFNAVSNPGAVGNYLSVQGRATAMKQAADSLISAGVSPEVVSLLSGNGKLRGIANQAMKDPLIGQIFEERDPKTVVSLLAMHNIQVNEQEAGQLMRAVQNLRDNDTGDVAIAMSQLESMAKAGDAAILLHSNALLGRELTSASQHATGNFASQLRSVADAATSFSDTANVDVNERMSRFSGLRSAAGSLVKSFLSSKDQGALLAQAGPASGLLQRAQSVSRSLTGRSSISQKELLKILNIGDDEFSLNQIRSITGDASGGMFSLNKDKITELAGLSGFSELQNDFARRGTSETAAAQDPLIQTLTKLDRNQDLTNTILLEIAGTTKGAAVNADRIKELRQQQENGGMN